jgi:hypothetical protein
VEELADSLDQLFDRSQCARFTKCTLRCHIYQSLAWVEFALAMTHLNLLQPEPAQSALEQLYSVTQAHLGALQMN